MSQTKGTLNATACPHCGAPQDMTDLPRDLVEAGTQIACDRCHRKSMIMRVQPVTMVWLKPI